MTHVDPIDVHIFDVLFGNPAPGSHVFICSLCTANLQLIRLLKSSSPPVLAETRTSSFSRSSQTPPVVAIFPAHNPR